MGHGGRACARSISAPARSSSLSSLFLFLFRTAAHISTADGKAEAFQALLLAGANVNAVDRWGATPLLEAVKAARAGKAGPELIDQVKAAGGTLGALSSSDLSGILCSAVQARDGALLGLYIRAGADPSAGDYDSR